MANFTDSINGFNPYVQQLPVDAMLYVGQTRQNQYDQGVQKIQTYIDNVAGIDVIKPAHKQYLQSKLNELGGNLKKVAAGDFSNYQLINSVGGMVTSVAKDPIVQNAAYSTQRIRKGQQEVEEARKTGKGSVQNEAYWNNQLNNWLEDGNVKSSFNGTYVPYTDMDSKLRTLAKDIPEVESVQDIPLMRDNSGAIMYFDAAGKQTAVEKGRPRTDAAMLRMSTKGKSAQKILDNFLSSLDENDMQQLNIDGWYHYRGASKNTFKNDVINTYNSNRRRLSNRMVELSTELSSNPKLTNSERSAIEAELSNYSNTMKSGQLERQKNEDISALDVVQNLDGYKQKLYTQKFLGSMANSLAYESIKRTYETNPYWQADMDLKKLQLDYDRLAKQDREFAMKFALDVDKHELEKSKFALDLSKTAGAPSGVAVSKSLITERDKPTIVGIDSQVQEINTGMTEFKNEHIKDIVAKHNDLDTVEQSEAFDRTYQQYKINPSTIEDGNVRAMLDAYRNMEVQKLDKINLRNSVNKLSKRFDDELINSLKAQPPLIVDETEYSAEEVYNAVKLHDEAFRNHKQPLMTNFEGTSMEPLAVALFTPPAQRTFSQKAIVKYATNLRGNKLASSIVDKKREFESQELARRSPEYQSSIQSLDLKNKAIETRVEGVINNTNALLADQKKLDLSEGQAYDPTVVNEWRSGKQKDVIGYSVQKNANGSGAVLIQNGADVQTIPLSAEELSANFPQYGGIHPVTSIINAVKTSETNTTNSAGIKNSVTGAIAARYTANDLPTAIKDTPIASKVRFDVEGAYYNNGSNNDRYQIIMYVYDDRTGEWKRDIVNKEGMIPAEGILPQFQNIGTKKVQEVLHSNK